MLKIYPNFTPKRRAIIVGEWLREALEVPVYTPRKRVLNLINKLSDTASNEKISVETRTSATSKIKQVLSSVFGENYTERQTASGLYSSIEKILKIEKTGKFVR